MSTYDAFANFRMADHVAIVTGGAQNIGAGIATALAGAGARVVIADLNGEKAKATAEVIEQRTGSPAIGIGCDVTSDADIQACIDTTVGTFGGISTLVNNVGWGEANADPFAVTEEQMVASYRLNTVSALRMTSAAVPYLRQAENASVANSGSMVSFLPAFDFLAYSSAKAALNHMMVGLAHALAKQVRVNTVLIGTIITDGYAAAGLDQATQDALAHPNNLTGRAGKPEDVGNAVLWLSSPAGSWVSGQIVQVAGGPSRVRLMPE